ncbi:hypothetical protein SERLA73DRAFT_68737 [Serpula lacrymans var. lacrymans S7.3]|uniref:Uncharacterized protein n=2 Tax=Serpula lacrymans var. lacrymans TaxID=341189 RepID=F8PHZ9_SERL3|nr:uncharacterized protein SERLADRAFT_432501 [Serpula lacrymans var. lacrymans S7.9]EGO05095.1 hypothetical protein SERLA73DRAFT_68737 [Serpula lacrymans var. lacrymans S7.3]EGO30860.1 hypothetical protein SERLADRAFT_432501 [Serpula lacrymans var. lacrymans S7.9]
MPRMQQDFKVTGSQSDLLAGHNNYSLSSVHSMDPTTMRSCLQSDGQVSHHQEIDSFRTVKPPPRQDDCTGMALHIGMFHPNSIRPNIPSSASSPASNSSSAAYWNGLEDLLVEFSQVVLN